jgi:DNA polymerase-4
MGRHGEHLLALSRGIDERPVVPEHEPKSIGHETTFEEDTDDPELVRKTLLWLTDAVALRLRKHGVKGHTVTLKFRDENFVTETRSHTSKEAIDDASEIFAVALAQLDRVEVAGRKIRLLGVSVSNFPNAVAPHQLSLFDSDRVRLKREKLEKLEKLSRARDALESRFGKGAVERASLLGSEDE